MAAREKVSGFEKFKQTMATLSWPERIDYLWTYYKWVIGVVILAVVVISIIVSCIYHARLDTLFGGTCVNVEFTDEGDAYLSDDWFALLGGREGKEEVNYFSTILQDPDRTTNTETNAAAAMSVIVLIGTQDLDYIIMDQIGMDYFGEREIFPSLEQVLSEQMLARMEDLLIYNTDEAGNTYPIAIDISEAAFIRNCAKNDGPVYIAFPGNTDRLALSEEFLEYILDWEPAA